MNADRNTAIALAAVLTAGFFTLLISSKGVFSQETAAWVQAIGAILAIIAAGVFATIPIRHAEKQRLDAKRDFVNAVIDAVQIATRDFEATAAAIGSRNPRQFAESARTIQTGDFAALQALLAEPIRMWPSPQLYVRANNLLKAVELFQRLTVEMAATIAHGKDWGLAKKLLDRYERDRKAYDQSIAGVVLD